MRSALLSLVLLAACGPGALHPEYSAAEGRAMTRGETRQEPPRAEVPRGRLPGNVTPISYQLWMEVVPSRERFRGRADITVRIDEPTQLVWLHGLGLEVSEAEALPDGAEPVRARYAQESDDGAASLRFDEPISGEVILTISYEAAFDRQLKGLYRVDSGGDSYAFTQFEATSARLAFPCFDEPRWKTPFELTLSVQADHRAVANTTIASSRESGGMNEVRFARTEPIPTYLLAMAVGPLEIVEHAAIPANAVRDRALPFRGVAARGRGARLRYALEHTGALLAYLEEYFGSPYPYDKLDVIAVPDFASGAMENVGAITFREQLLLLNDDAPEDQRRDFAYVMAHELAHMWFGNLVTMPWWDDIWLNEAFATWMGNKAVRRVHPEYQADIGMVSGVHGAMRADSLTSARQIRQPIDSTHDIRNAFDVITYTKGGGVLEMFERWVGEDVFRDGVRDYLAAHRFGTATSDDFLDSISRTAGRDVGTPFRTFLNQPGVPLLAIERTCSDGSARVTVRQSRYFPVGSPGERAASWQLPVCLRYPVGRELRTTCELATSAESSIALEGCPAWVMPNADAAGYYRFSMPAADVDVLMRSGWSRLSARERVSLADNLVAGFEADAIDAAVVLAAMPAVASDSSRPVATSAMRIAGFTREHLVAEEQRAGVERWAAGLYQTRARRLGWAPGRREDGETALLRESLLGFLAHTARDARVRRDAAERGRRYVGFGGDGAIHPEAVSRDLAGLALAIAVQESDAAFFDHLQNVVFASDDALFRSEGLAALGSTRDPVLAQRALELSLDPRVPVNEVTTTIGVQLGMEETRAAAWTWMQANFDRVFARVASTRAGFAPWMTAGFCSEERAREVEAFFAPRIESLAGGPRNLRGALEAIRLCAARVEAQRESASTFVQSL
jgi:alanyl aminopeptidase